VQRYYQNLSIHELKVKTMALSLNPPIMFTPLRAHTESLQLENQELRGRLEMITDVVLRCGVQNAYPKYQFVHQPNVPSRDLGSKFSNQTSLPPRGPKIGNDSPHEINR
jgi:hypothetical protein